MGRLQFNHGLEANAPLLPEKGEPYYCTDSNILKIGNSSQQFVGIPMYVTGRTAEAKYPNGVGVLYATAQEALNAAFTGGGKVYFHPNKTPITEILTGKNGVDIVLDGDIETNVNDTASITFASANATISGEGSIRNLAEGPAVATSGTSVVTLRNKYIYTAGKALHSYFYAAVNCAGSSTVNIFCDKVETANQIAISYRQTSKGFVNVKQIVAAGGAAVNLEGSGNVTFANCEMIGRFSNAYSVAVVQINTTGGTKLFENCRIEHNNVADNAINGIILPVSFTGGTIILSGVDIVQTSNDSIIGSIASYREDEFGTVYTTIYVRKPSWASYDVGTGITTEGAWSYGY